MKHVRQGQLAVCMTIALCCAVTTACSQPHQRSATRPARASTDRPVEPEATGAAHSAPKSPIHARLDGPTTVPQRGEIQLRLTVDRRVAVAPVTIELRAPAGTSVIAGPRTATLTNPAVGAHIQAWTLRYDALPAGNATVIVDWQTKAAGFHAELPYRFGRAEPKVAEPRRLPGKVRLPGGGTAGRPILTGGEAKTR